MNTLLGFNCEDDRDDVTAKNILRVLNHHYPGHEWYVEIRQGWLQVWNHTLGGEWGWQGRVSSIDPDYKVIMRLGGGLLERYKLRRAGVSDQELRDLPIDFRGHYVRDASSEK